MPCQFFHGMMTLTIVNYTVLLTFLKDLLTSPMFGKSLERSLQIMILTRGQSRFTCTLIRGIIRRESLPEAKEEMAPDKETSTILTTREVVQLEMLILDMKVLIIELSIKL